MRYGYWLPVFGGWLRNVDNEGMDASWDYVRRLAVRSEKLGFDVAFIPECSAEEVKQPDTPVLDAWSTAAALAAVTRRVEFIVSADPARHPPQLLAKTSASIDRISGGRLALHLATTAPCGQSRQFGLPVLSDPERHRQASEWLAVVDGLWRHERFTYEGHFYRLREAVIEPKPLSRPRPPVYGEAHSKSTRVLTARGCDGCLLRGATPERAARTIANMRERREQAGRPPLIYAMSAFVVLRNTEREARDEWQRITNVKQSSASYHRYQQWLTNTHRNSSTSLEDFAAPHSALRAGLIGTREHVLERIAQFERAGIELLVLQCSPQLQEMDRFASAVIATEQSHTPGTSWSTSA